MTGVIELEPRNAVLGTMASHLTIIPPLAEDYTCRARLVRGYNASK